MQTDSRWQMRIENSCLFIDDIRQKRVILQHNARSGLRPYIHPLRTIDDTVCLTEDSPGHHPWQHGVQTGFHGVNGCDFWLDPGQNANLPIGSIEPISIGIIDRIHPSWTIEAIWRNTEGQSLLLEHQNWSLGLDSAHMILDLIWKLQAISDVRIEQHSYGGLFVRMPFRQYYEASVFNSAGQQGDETEQQPARWVSLHMPIEGSSKGGGIAILDHPANPDHPVKWRVDGQRGINPSPCIKEEMNLETGEAVTYRYRLVLQTKPLTFDQLTILWEKFAQV